MINARGTLLVVEDDQLDVMTLQRAFREVEIPNALHVSRNGEEALAYLHDTGNRRPSLIFLDLNMPRMNGIEVLQSIKHDPRLRQIPVIILTTSNHDRDKQACFSLSVAGYFVKPMDYHQFVDTVRIIRDYWFTSETLS